MKFLLDSSEACVRSANEIGSKAFRLGQLNRIEMPVPRWCVLPAECLLSRMNQNGLHLSGDDTAELRFWLERRQREGHHRFIVRASVQLLKTGDGLPAEDSVAASVLGNLEAYPNLKSFESVQNAIFECVKSVQAARQDHYAIGANGAANPVAETWSQVNVSVIVQVMMDADRSGVLFTVDPKDGNRRHFLITSNFGACESVVSGQFECDEFEIHLSDETIVRRIAKKTKALKFANLAAEGLTTYDLPPFMQTKASLDDNDLAHVIAMGKQLTLWAKIPLDVEWVMHGKDLWIVQMRPLPAIGSDRSHQNEYSFNRAALPAMNEMALPITSSFAAELAAVFATELGRLLGHNRRLVAQQRETVRRHLLGTCAVAFT